MDSEEKGCLVFIFMLTAICMTTGLMREAQKKQSIKFTGANPLLVSAEVVNTQTQQAVTVESGWYTVTINTGESGAFSSEDHTRLFYGGMISETAFSMVFVCPNDHHEQTLYKGDSRTIFYSAKKDTEIKFAGMTLFVESVTPERISLRYQPPQK